MEPFGNLNNDSFAFIVALRVLSIQTVELPAEETNLSHVRFI